MLASVLSLTALLFFAMSSSAQPPEEPAGVPRQENAFEQFSHAMFQYYLPAARETGEKRKDLCLKAIPAFEAVRTYFPKNLAPLLLMESWFYQGKCHKVLGDKRKAADAFLTAFRQPIPGTTLDDEEADLAVYHFHAYRELQGLRDVLTPQERAELDLEEAPDKE
jgi:hypothetical protein